jgi:hypothetical protein
MLAIALLLNQVSEALVLVAVDLPEGLHEIVKCAVDALIPLRLLGMVEQPFVELPADLTGVGLATWEHLAATFADQPTRFREADRRAVVAYCCAVEMADEAAKALREHGVLVAGRSESDNGRPVRSPAWAM